MSAAVATTVAVIVLAGPARASDNAVYDELARLNPGTTAAEMQAEARAQSAAAGQSPEQVAAEALAEARANSSAQGPAGAASSSSSGGSKSKKLPEAVVGDIFWWDSATDHVGLYYLDGMVVHAPGVGKKVTVQLASEVGAPKHTELMLVNTKNDGKTRVLYSWRKGAADWAKKKKGKPYNSNFAFNKKINASKYNCSQLVWAAWKATTTIDLDNGASKGVYPGDIRADRRTHVYKKSI